MLHTPIGSYENEIEQEVEEDTDGHGGQQSMQGNILIGEHSLLTPPLGKSNRRPEETDEQEDETTNKKKSRRS